MQLARVRQKELANAIARLEAEIGKICEEVETLDRFIQLGEDLIRRASSETVVSSNFGIEDHDEAKSAGDPFANIVMPVRQTQSA